MNSPRRHFLALSVAVALLPACGKGGERCGTCGMKVDPASAFRATVASGSRLQPFDTNRCALTALRAGGGKLTVQEFYSRAPVDGAAVRYVIGSDVLGPMGPDLIAVDPAKVDKFARDHGSARALTLGEIDDSALNP